MSHVNKAHPFDVRRLSKFVLFNLLLMLVVGVSPIFAQTKEDSFIPQAVTEMSMSSDSGDFVGGGRNYYYAPGDGTYYATAKDLNNDGTIDTVGFIYNGSIDNWSLEFSTRLTGANMTPNYYNNAVRHPFESGNSPGLSVSGNGRGCNQLSGSFTVHAATFDYSSSPPRVEKFAASFEQHCENGPTAFYGTIYFNYTPSGNTFSTAGQLLDNNGIALSGRTVSLFGSKTTTTTTDSSGNYQFSGLLPGGNFRIVPTDSNLLFSPRNRIIRRILSDQTMQNFTAVPLYSISGQVLNSSGSPISDVTVRVTGSQTLIATTDQEGRYNFPNLLASGSYTVNASRVFYTFTPPFRIFDTLEGNEILNFVGNIGQFSISGRILNSTGTGISGVRIDLSGGENRSVTTDGNGIYSFDNLNAGNDYQVRPISSSYTFNPGSQSFYALDRNYSGVMFSAGLPTVYSISGFVLGSDGNGVASTTIQLSGSSTGKTTTDVNGFYSFSGLLAGNTFTITPLKNGYNFRPQNRIISSLSGNIFANFVGNTQRIGADFDGDLKTDISIFRPSVGEWYFLRSSNSVVNGATFGSSTDKPIPADYTGDGKTDFAFFRPSNGEWFVLRSEDSSFYAFPFGSKDDIPTQGDFDGDGKADVAVFRPSNGVWYIAKSTGGITIQPFGTNGDRPVVADYDGDGKSDIAIFRPSVGEWYALKSSGGITGAAFGSGSDKTVQGDYTGDGKADFAFYRPSIGNWFVLRSEDFSFYASQFGVPTDMPTAGDYDGDGKFDQAVFRPSNGVWYLNKSDGSGVTIQPFGASMDIPVPGYYLP